MNHDNEHVAAAVALYERERITLGGAARLADEDDAASDVAAASELGFDDEPANDDDSRVEHG